MPAPVTPAEQTSPDVPTPPVSGPSDSDESPYAARPWLASYPDGVPADYDFPEVPLTRLLDDATASFPSRPALAFRGLTTTYREVRDAADHLAAGLAGLGVRKGDRVSIVLPNCPQLVLTVFAVLRLGAVVVQHDPASTDGALRAQLSHCGSRVVVCLDQAHGTVVRAAVGSAVRWLVVTHLHDDVASRTRRRPRLPLPAARRARDRPLAASHPHATTVPFGRLVRTPSAARQTPVEPVRDPAVLQYVGGTTTAPRAVLLTHGNLVSHAYMNRLWDPGGTVGGEVTIGVLPLSSALGMTVGLNATILLAGTLVLLPSDDVDELVAAVDRWRPTMLPATPSVFRALAVREAGRHDLSSLRVCVSCAVHLPRAVQERFERLSGARLVEGHGPTQALPSTHCNPLSDRRRPGTVGLPLPGTACRVVDPDDRAREVPIGTAGELHVRGPQVSTACWGTDGPVLTPDGWLPTGELVTMDADGFFTVVDRAQDLASGVRDGSLPGAEEPAPRRALRCS